MIVLPFKEAYAGMNNINVQYRGHVAEIGWQNWVQNGELAGTAGMSSKLEALE